MVNTYKDKPRFGLQMSKRSQIESINSLVKNCKKCDLWKTRNNAVPGNGSMDTKILFVGEAPGYNEDLQGLPFVGKAGKILDELLQKVGIKREEIYIANILKCRPPGNRNPLRSEIETCTPYLNKQIEIIQPEVIIPLGSFAASYIFEKFGLKFEKISIIHGRVYTANTLYGKIKLIPMYHPAVATYNPNTLQTLVEDFKSLEKTLNKS